MDTPETANSLPETPSLPVAAKKPQGIGTSLALGLAFALCGVLIALRTLAVEVLPHIITPNDISRFQEIGEGYPIPKTLDWNTNLIDFFLILRDPNPVLAIVVLLGLGIVLWIIMVALLNPTFRPISTTDEATESVPPLTKAFHLLLKVIVPVGLAYALAAVFLRGTFGFAVQIAILIFGMSIGFRREGIAGDFARPEFNFEKIPYAEFFLISAAYGAIVAWVRALLPQRLSPTLEVYQMLGTFHEGYLSAVATHWFAMMGLVWFLCAVLLFIMIRGATGLRIAGVCLIFLSFAGAFLNRIALDPGLLAVSLDAVHIQESIPYPYTPRFPHTGISTGTKGAEILADRLDIKWIDPEKSPPPTQNLVIFDRRPWFVGMNTCTDDGQPIEPQSLSKIAKYYQDWHGMTALNWNAIRWQLSAATARFDTSKALELALQDLVTAPHVSRTAPFVREIFFTCAANARNHAALDKLANERDFAFPDRESLRMMGDLYRRFGDKEKALSWYRRAEMPQSFLKARQEEKPMFRQGTVHGRLTFDGKPLAGVLVGVLPRRLNGLPRDLEGSLLGAIEEIVPRFFPRPGGYVRSAAAFRWISASALTDAEGKFEFHDLTEGEYAFVTTLSPLNQPKRYDMNAVQIRTFPRPFVLNYTHATEELGTVAFRLNPAAPTAGKP